jgi:hypothetical protein
MWGFNFACLSWCTAAACGQGERASAHGIRNLLRRVLLQPHDTLLHTGTVKICIRVCGLLAQVSSVRLWSGGAASTTR